MLQKLLNASEAWIDIANEIEDNGGELTPELEGRFDVAVKDMSEVSDQLANTLDYIDTAVEVAKRKKDRYALKAKQFTNFKEKIRTVTKNLMLEGIEFAGEDRKVLLTKATNKINVDDVDMNTLENKDRYTKVVVTLDKVKLKRDIKDGVIDLPEGAFVTQERTLQVR